MADVGHDRAATSVQDAIAVVADEPHVFGALDHHRGRGLRDEGEPGRSICFHHQMLP